MKLRFSIRDILWLTLLVALCITWRLDVARASKRAAIQFKAIDFAQHLYPVPSADEMKQRRHQANQGRNLSFKDVLFGLRKRTEQYLDELDKLIAEEQ